MESQNLYELLQCSQNESSENIKLQFKRLALKFHPDKNSSDTNSDEFDALKKAYTILSCPESRREYDIQLLRNSSQEADMIVTDSISISDFCRSDEIENDTALYYDCRCGGQFVIENIDDFRSAEHHHTEKKNITEIHVQCYSCSLFLHVTGIEQ